MALSLDLGNLIIRIKADTKQFDSAFDSAIKKTRTSAKSIVALTQAMDTSSKRAQKSLLDAAKASRLTASAFQTANKTIVSSSKRTSMAVKTNAKIITNANRSVTSSARAMAPAMARTATAARTSNRIVASSATQMGPAYATSARIVVSAAARIQAALARVGTAAGVSAGLVQKAAIGMGRSMGQAGAFMRRSADRMTEAGRRLNTSVVLPLTILGVTAVKEFTKFEDAMIEVEKVTNRFTAQSLTKQLDEMTKTLPLTATELGNLAASAARFGIRGTEAIQNFVKVTAMMATNTNLSIEEAALAFARLPGLMGTAQDEIENMGSAINILGETYATNSQDIVKASMRSANAMNRLGLSGQEILGLATVMNEFWHSAERAGTAQRSLATALLKPSVVEKIAGALGKTVEQIEAMRKANPMEFMIALGDEMVRGSAAGRQLAASMDSLAVEAITKMARAQDKVRGAVALTHDEWNKATSLQDQFKVAMRATSNQLALFRNAFQRVQRDIGGLIIPTLLKFASSAMKVFDAWMNLSTSTKSFILILAGVTAVMGPILVMLGHMVFSVAALIGVMAILAKMFAFAVAVFVKMAVVLGPVIAALLTVKGIIGIAIVGAIMALLKWLGLLDKAWDKTKDAAGEAMSQVSMFFDRVKKSFRTVVLAVGSGNFAGAVKVMWAQIVMEFWNGIRAISRVLDFFIQGALKIWDSFRKIVLRAGLAMNVAFLTAIRGIITVLKHVINAGISLATKFAKTINTILRDAMESVGLSGQFFQDNIDVIVEHEIKAKEGVNALAGKVEGAIDNRIVELTDRVTNAIQKIDENAQKRVTLEERAASKMEEAAEVWKNAVIDVLAAAAVAATEGALVGVRDTINQLRTRAGQVQNIVNAVPEAHRGPAQEAFNQIRPMARALMNVRKSLSVLREQAGSVRTEAGKERIEAQVKKLTAQADSLTAGINEQLNKAVGLAKEGQAKADEAKRKAAGGTLSSELAEEPFLGSTSQGSFFANTLGDIAGAEIDNEEKEFRRKALDLWQKQLKAQRAAKRAAEKDQGAVVVK
jgi:TP901 family phage tail tape measure protein